MTVDNIKTFLTQLKYDREYAQNQIFCSDWYELVHDIFWRKPYHISYSPQELNRYTEFVEFLDGNGYIIRPLHCYNGFITVDISPE